MIRYRPWLALSLLAVVLVLGCGGNPNAATSVSGKVSYKDAPVTGGTMHFKHADGGMLTTTINSDGTYQLSGIPPGKYLVTIETESLNPEKKAQYGGGRGKMREGPRPQIASSAPTGTYVKIPAKYASEQNSGLDISLDKGKQTKDFPLTD
jgi:hypothetical protein